MDSIYIPEISQYEPGVVEGGMVFTRDASTFDVRLSLVTVHPTELEDISKFNGYSATVLLHPKIDIRSFANAYSTTNRAGCQKSGR